MLAREVLRLRGTLATRDTEWDVMTDLYFYRDPEAEENKEVAEEAKVPGAEEAVPQAFDSGADWEVTGAQGSTFAPPAASGAPGGSWDTDAPDWSAGVTQAPAGGEWAADTVAEPTTSSW